MSTFRVKTGSATGTVNVGVSASNVNINTEQPGGVTIGNGFATGTTTSINSPNVNIGTTVSGTTAIFSPTINVGIGVGSTISIGTNGGVTTLGTTNLENLNATTVTNGIDIGNNITSGAINIGNGSAFTGSISIGKSSTRTATIDVGTEGSGAINVGNTTVPLTLAGSTIALQNGASTGGTINIKNGASSTGDINIKSGTSSAGNINIFNNSESGGDLNIKSNATASGTINIANATGTVPININTNTGTGAITIGNSAATLALRGSTTTFSSPLTLGSLPHGGSTTQLGSYNTVNGTNISGTANYQQLTTLTNLPIGVYILSGSTFINSSNWTANLQFGVLPTTQNSGLNNLQSFNGASAGVILTTQIWIQGSVQNVYFSGTGATANFQNIQATYVRIA